MNTEQLIVLIGLAAWLVCFLVGAILAFRSDYHSGWEKLKICVFCFVVPIVGGLLTISILRSEVATRYKPGQRPQDSAVGAAPHSSGFESSGGGSGD